MFTCENAELIGWNILCKMHGMGKADSILLITDDSYLKALLQILDQAQSNIDILAFSFAIGSAAGRFALTGSPYEIALKLTELKKKRKRLKIRLYIEGERETSDRNTVTANFLKKAGIQVRFGATHAKGFCVDNKFVLFGSTNLTEQSIKKNNETNLFVSDLAAVNEFSSYFNHLWNGGGHGGIQLSQPMYADGDFKPMLIDLIDSTQKQIHFSIYFFRQKDIEAALVRAHKRGVKMTGFIHNHFAFAMSYVRRTHSTIRRLREAGIKSLYMAPGHLFTHSKYLISDLKRLALGTGNWLDEDVEIHPQLYIKIQNQRLAKQLARHLSRQIEASGSKTF